MTPSERGDIAVVGLGVMGFNLARNLARNGFSVVGYDVEAQRREQLVRAGDRLQAAATPQQLVQSLAQPRRILIMVPAGAAVDAVIAELKPLLAPGDVLVDGGNTRFTDTQRRMGALAGSGILYVGAGVSGGEQGALTGPAIMPGGDPQAWPVVKHLLQAISAKAADGAPCCEWMGGGASGHFVKMVHNGIEYADMQLICEAYALMQSAGGLPPREAGRLFGEWNRDALDSYLLGITSEILARKDDETGKPLVDLILDTAEQKGTGKWATQAALDLGVPAATMGDAVFARTISAVKNERVAASAVLKGPAPAAPGGPELLAKLRLALLAGRVCAYAQGFQLLAAADAEYQWQLSFGTIAAVWRAGCIIRSSLLEDIRAAYAREPELANLLIDPHFTEVMADCHQALREVVAAAALNGTPVPALMSALAYYDSYRTARLPANLLQAQRDFFGAHGYQRIDRPGKFHTDWTQAG